MRRAALHSVGWDDGQDYLFDVLKQPEVLASRARGADLRSLLYLLNQWRRNPQPQQLLWQSGPLPATWEEQLQLVDLVGRGLIEMSRWLKEKGGDFISST